MRESASRGFWVSSYAPFGYNRVMVQDGAKKRPSLQPNPDASHIVKRIFDMAEAGNGMTDITSITTSVQGGMWGDARMAARRLAWERLARSLLSCVSSSHRSNSVGPNRSRGSISRTTR